MLDHPCPAAQDSVAHSFGPHACPTPATLFGVGLHPVPGTGSAIDRDVAERRPIAVREPVGVNERRQPRWHVTRSQRGIAIRLRKQRHPPHRGIDNVAQATTRAGQVEIDETDWLAGAEDNVLWRDVEVADHIRRWLNGQIGGHVDVNVVAEPGCISRRNERRRSLVQPTKEVSNTDENGAGSRPRLHKRLAWYIASDELQDVATSFVDPEVARRLREANPVEVLQIAGDRTRPRPMRTADSVAHTHNSQGYVAASQRHLDAVRGFIDGLDVHLTGGYSRHLQIGRTPVAPALIYPSTMNGEPVPQLAAAN